LGQSWWRKIKSLGLSKLYNDNRDDSDCLKYFFGLPFLGTENIIDCFTDDFLAILPAENDRIVKYADYIFENYISPGTICSPEYLSTVYC